MTLPLDDRSSPRRAGETSAATGGSSSIQRASEMLGLVANPDRLKILLILEDSERTVSDLLSDFPGATDQFVSRHLGVLRRNGLVEDRVSGTFRIYALTGAGRRMIEAIQSLNGL